IRNRPKPWPPLQTTGSIRQGPATSASPAVGGSSCSARRLRNGMVKALGWTDDVLRWSKDRICPPFKDVVWSRPGVSGNLTFGPLNRHHCLAPGPIPEGDGEAADDGIAASRVSRRPSAGVSFPCPSNSTREVGEPTRAGGEVARLKIERRHIARAPRALRHGENTLRRGLAHCAVGKTHCAAASRIAPWLRA